MYRLHIDIPLGTNERSLAVAFVEKFMGLVSTMFSPKKYGIQVGYRLGHDNDSNKKNHLRLDENGHVGTTKDYLEI